MKYVVTQDRWCALCSAPAAFVVRRTHRKGPVVAYACQPHRARVVDHLTRGITSEHPPQEAT